MSKPALQRLIDGPDDDCTRGAVEQHFCQDRGKCACIDEIVTAVSGRIAELEALLREIDNKVIFETAVHDGTGRDLQERVEKALGIGREG